MLFSTLRVGSGSSSWAWSNLGPRLYSTLDPRGVYNERLAANELSADEHQARVIEQFQRLHSDVSAFEPRPPATPSLLSNLFFGSNSR